MNKEKRVGLRPDATEEKILEIVFDYANDLFGQDRVHGAQINPDHIARVHTAVSNAKQIRFILPAFPAKSPNPEKTSGALPDWGEVLGLKRLQRLCDRIGEIYAPGAHVTICSDGRVFSDLVRVSEDDVTRYAEEIQKIIFAFGLSSLSTFNLDDCFDGKDYERMRENLVEKHGRSVEDVREKVRGDASERALFNGIHRFMFEDGLYFAGERSRNRVREDAKKVAYGVILRSNAWSSYIETLFPEAIRLSIHPQMPGSRKIGIHLVPHQDRWATPWHSVALFEKDQFRLVKRREALALGAEPRLREERYVYYGF